MSPLLTIKETAARLGVSLRTARVLVASRKLAAIRVTSRCLRVEESEIARFVAAHREGGYR